VFKRGGKLNSSKVKRKTFVAREDLLYRISEMAKQRGYTVYDMVNMIFELAVKAEAAGIDIDRIVEERAILNVAKEAGFILGLESLWHGMADLAYRKARDEASKMWFEAGVWLAKRYTTGDYNDSLLAFKQDLETFAMKTYEFNLQRVGKFLRVSIIGPSFPESYAFFLLRFLEGALETFGYKVVEGEALKGLVRLEARQG
jgi:hypothetical protein